MKMNAGTIDRRDGRRRNGDGFTLLEVLLASAIVVLVAGTMMAVIGIGFRLKRVAEDAVDEVRDIHAAGDIFVDDLKSTLPPNVNSSTDPNTIGGTGSTGATGSTGSTAAASGGVATGNGVPLFLFGSFLGDNQSVRFYSTAVDPKAVVQSGATYEEFLLAGGSLVRRINSNLLSDDALQDPDMDADQEVLIQNVQSVIFQYIDENGNVTDGWDSTQTDTLNSLPYAVTMELTLAPLHPGDASRVITRYATIPCAAPLPTDTTTTGTTGTTGLGN